MRRITWPFPLALLLCGSPAQPVQAHPALGPSIAFYYGGELPAAALAQFDRVVVQADRAGDDALALLRRRHSEVLAYVSLSEVGRSRAALLDPSWQLGENRDWQSVIMDAAQPQFQEWLIEKQVRPLWQQGFRGLFLDNLDSYQRAVRSDGQKRAQVAGLVRIIRALHVRFPGIKLLFNRGFELLPEVAALAAGLCAESLFQGWDPQQKRYVEVPVADRDWLLAALLRARDTYHLPITAIDYVVPGQRRLARLTAQRIAALGITPWVTDQALTTLGVGAVEVIPRRVLALYNGAEQHDRGAYGDIAYAAVHRHAAVVLEQLGYAIDYIDVSEPLPTGPLFDRYAGIVTWFTDELVPNQRDFQRWLLHQIDDGLRVAVLDHLGFFPEPLMQRRLGFTRDDGRTVGKVRLVAVDAATTGFEAKVLARQNVFYPLRATGDSVRNLLSVEDSSGGRMDAVFTAWWGGVALDPYLLDQGPVSHYRWIINPFAFLAQALQLEALPAADVTTLAGQRMLIVHIDGDGFPSRAMLPGNDYSGKVILDQILRRYPIKTTVSVIEGELGTTGRWPLLSPALEAIARDIFALPNVEVASHSFSHPFSWLTFGKDLDDGSVNGLFRYDYSLAREIAGSVDYINRRLAPKDKPVAVFLWSGEAVAPIDALAQVKAAGIFNMNGGDTIMSGRRPTLTNVSSMGRPLGGYYQTYAPIQNEILFTNEWKGPHYGFREVISTFRMTEKPRRLKPIDIYFHFYSGSKLGSLKALRQVFDWALAQNVVSVYASDYIRKVEDFQQLTLGRRLDGCWQLRGAGDLTTLRLDSDAGLGAVDRQRSVGVTSVHALAQGRYIGLDQSGRAILCFAPLAEPLATRLGK